MSGAIDGYLAYVQHYSPAPQFYNLVDFQYNDITQAIIHQVFMILRSRKGGKTRDMTLVIVFWAVILELAGIWFAPFGDQLKQAKEWFHYNPFVTAVNQYSISFCSGPELDIGMLSPGRTASKDKSFAVYDELGKVPIDQKLYESYTYSRAIIAAHTKVFFRILYGSTTCIASALEEEFLSLDPSVVSLHTYHDCNWISDEWVESERAKHMNDPWYVLQEYECQWVVRGGACLNNIKLESPETIQQFRANQAGVDINKLEAVVGVYLTQDHKDVYIMYEYELDWVADHNCFDFLYDQIPLLQIEVENGGYNEKEALDLAFRIHATPSYWTTPIKQDRLAKARSMTIHICPQLTPKTYTDLRTLVYAPIKGIYLKDALHPCHWTDAFFHALGVEGYHFHETPPQPKPEQSGSQYLTELIRVQQRRGKI